MTRLRPSKVSSHTIIQMAICDHWPKAHIKDHFLACKSYFDFLCVTCWAFPQSWRWNYVIGSKCKLLFSLTTIRLLQLGSWRDTYSCPSSHFWASINNTQLMQTFLFNKLDAFHYTYKHEGMIIQLPCALLSNHHRTLLSYYLLCVVGHLIGHATVETKFQKIVHNNSIRSQFIEVDSQFRECAKSTCPI